MNLPAPHHGQTKAKYEGKLLNCEPACLGIGYSKIPVAASQLHHPLSSPGKTGAQTAGILRYSQAARAEATLNLHNEIMAASRPQRRYAIECLQVSDEKARGLMTQIFAERTETSETSKMQGRRPVVKS